MAYSSANSKPIYISRVINASPDALFEALTQPGKFKQWWGPKNFTCPFFKNEPRVGGGYLACMEAPDGKAYWTTGEYQEFRPAEKLVFTDCFADKDGNILTAYDYGMSGDWPLECLVTITLAGLQNQTTLTLEHRGIPEEEQNDCIKGWNESFVKLNELLSASGETRRTFRKDSSTSYYEPSPL